MISMVIGMITLILLMTKNIIQAMPIIMVMLILLILNLLKIWWEPVEPPDDGGKKSLRVVKDNDPATSFLLKK